LKESAIKVLGDLSKGEIFDDIQIDFDNIIESVGS